jgi:apolipoprotein N-acyltransferase
MRYGPLTIGMTSLLVIAGLAQAVSLAWPLEGAWRGLPLGALQCASLAVLAAVLDRSQTVRQAFAQSWVFALAWIAGSTWWLFISLHTFGELPAPLAVLAVFLLAAGLSLFYGVAGAVFHRLCAHTQVGVLARATAFAACWMLAELVRGTLWTGFPWGAGGYAHIDGWMRHWAPWVGVYGVCALSAGLAMVVGARRQTRTPRGVFAYGVTAVVVLLLGWTWLNSPSQTEPVATTSPLRVTLLQGNIPQDLKFGATGVGRALRDYREGLLASAADLTVTPETALPMSPEQLPDGYWARVQQRFSTGTQAALIGMPLVQRRLDGQRQYSNSAVALMPQATPASTAMYQYDKHHLVPFGEFVPPLFQWFVRMLNIPLGDFTRGDVTQPLLHFKGERIAPNICYEDLFGEELARSFANPDQAPTLMVNLSNIAWFGDTVAIDQHLHISRMRALEFGRPMLRATNTGATAVINAQGEVTHRLPSAVAGVLHAEVTGVHGAVTPYARWVGIYGLWPLVAVALLGLAGVAVSVHSGRHGQRRFGP